MHAMEALRDCGFFARLENDEMSVIAELGRFVDFPGGHRIYGQGSMCDTLFVLSRGEVHLQREYDLAGGRTAVVTVDRLRKGRVLGCWCALVGEPRAQMCSAHCQRSVSAFALECRDLRSTILEQPDLGRKLMERLVLMLKKRLEFTYGVLETI